jgi:UDP-glucose 4-epimerase
MKIAITGASGYLGQLLSRRLVAEPAVESILALDIAPSSLASPKYHYQKADVLTDDFKKLLGGVDVIYHLAFIVSPPKDKSVAEIDKINIVGSERVFEGAIAAGVKKVIYSSSVSAYGAHPDNPEVIYEDTPLRPNPDWYYSRTKGKVEEFLDRLQARSPETTIIRFRPCIFLGPSIANPVVQVISLPVLFCVNRYLKVGLCWDEDVVEALFLALSYGQSDRFNLAGDTPLTFNEIGKLLGKTVVRLPLGAILPWLRLARYFKLISPHTIEWINVGTSGSILVSSEKAKRKLGWKPRFDDAGALLEFARVAMK